MATEKLLGLDIVAATADLRTAQYKLITRAGALAGAGVAAWALQDKPNTGQNGTIATHGITKVIYGGTVTAGQLLAANASGLAIVATTGQRVVGVARVSGVANDVGSMEVPGSGLA
jgi:hypothetical protein